MTLSRTTLLMRRLRAERYKAGLTAVGTDRVNTPRPELKGLTGGAYHTAYMRLQRENDRKAYGQENKSLDGQNRK